MGKAKEFLRVLRPLLNRAGYDVVRWPGIQHGHMRARILDRLAVDLVIDVGANVGQYGHQIRAWGYSGEIRSFEPMEAAYTQLRRTSRDDANWLAVRSAVGAQRGSMTINVSANSISSSFLPMLDRHADVAPRSVYVRTEVVPVDRLDALIDANSLVDRRPFLKIDTQGYESVVLDGAGDMLDQFIGVELEMSLVPLYEGQALLPETIATLADLGFRLTEISPGLSDPTTGDSLQVDGIFVRR